MRLRLIVAAVLPALAFGQVKSDPPIKTARIAGRILESGMPLSSKAVRLTGRPYLNGLTAQTAEDGTFVFPAVRAGQRYSLCISVVSVLGKDITEADNIGCHNEFDVPAADTGIAPTYIEVGKLDVAGGATVDLGDIALQVPKDTGASGDIVGPVKRTQPSSTGKGTEPGRSVAAVFVGAAAKPAIIQDNGAIVQAATEKEQVGVRDLKISEDRTAVGWLVDSPPLGMSYSLAHQLVVYRLGTPHHFTGDGRAIFGWKFIGGGRQVAFQQSFPHGDLGPHYELRDVQTERLMGTWDPDEQPKEPAWLKGVFF